MPQAQFCHFEVTQRLSNLLPDSEVALLYPVFSASFSTSRTCFGGSQQSLEFFDVAFKCPATFARQTDPSALSAVPLAFPLFYVANLFKLFNMLGQDRIAHVQFGAQHLKLGFL